MEHADEDLLLDRRYLHRQQMSRQGDDSFTSLESMLRILNLMTSPNFLIGFTICIILIFQFRELILGWLSERGFLDVCLDIWETIAFYLRTAWNMLNAFLSVPDNNGGLQQQQQSQTTTRRGRHATMPDLEEPLRNGHAPMLEATKTVDNTRVEPAFLDPKQYPPGWLVYDPNLGVVPREYVAKNGGTVPV